MADGPDGPHDAGRPNGRLDAERAAWIAVALTPGIGAARLAALLTEFGSASAILDAPGFALRHVPGVGAALRAALRARSTRDGEQVVVAAAAVGGRVLIPSDPEFPACLREVDEPPAVLFARGRVDLLQRPAIAVVGSRDHTRYGADVCRAVAVHVAGAGVVVVSGMARGLDAIAHAAALDAGGRTIGVLGNGLGVVYPAANRALYDRVAAEGLLLTEFPPGDKPTAGSFPRRNRLISGLARITVVVEAAAGSGALITAGTALEQGREVAAVPGPVTSETSVGCNRLIRDGATPLLDPTDLHPFYPEIRAWPLPAADPPGVRALPDGLSAAERTLAELLTRAPAHIDALARELERPVGLLLSQLGVLEIAGVVEQRPTGMFRRV
ncbi:MAG TPA: DNA-processing protein DprA [Gemmatimonadales bacterium]|nr:DNA-processing protein DprA [Gemmatimonadales bacterium]